eukprot:4493530-Amphidinium_carterae.4
MKGGLHQQQAGKRAAEQVALALRQRRDWRQRGNLKGPQIQQHQTQFCSSQHQRRRQQSKGVQPHKHQREVSMTPAIDQPLA